MTRPLKNAKLPTSKATISITAEETAANDNAEMVKFTPEATLSSTSGLNFFIIYKNMGPNSYLPVYKSEIKNPLSGSKFVWNEV